jgi:hypothetical protein
METLENIAIIVLLLLTGVAVTVVALAGLIYFCDVSNDD